MGLHPYPLCSDFSGWDLPAANRSFVKDYPPYWSNKKTGFLILVSLSSNQ